MVNKCAKFHKDSLKDKKVKFNLPSATELSETADFVYNFVQKPYASEQLRWRIWPFPLNLFMKFSQKMPLNLFYTMVQKSQKWPKTQIKGGSCLKMATSTRWLTMVLLRFLFVQKTKLDQVRYELEQMTRKARKYSGSSKMSEQQVCDGIACAGLADVVNNCIPHYRVQRNGAHFFKLFLQRWSFSQRWKNWVTLAGLEKSFQ